MKPHKYFYILILFLVGCHSADYYLKQGHDIGLTGDYKAAILLFNKAIQKNPKLKEAYIQKGLCYEYINQYDSAVISYKALLSFDPNNTMAFYYIGLCKFKHDQFKESIEYYNKAFITKGVNPSDSFNVILDLNKDGLLGEIAAYDIPSHELYYKRGIAYYSLKDIKKAYSDFQNCIQQGYYVGQSYYMVGLCWLAVNKNDKACDAFKEGSFNGDSLATKQFNELCK